MKSFHRGSPDYSSYYSRYFSTVKRRVLKNRQPALLCLFLSFVFTSPAMPMWSLSSYDRSLIMHQKSHRRPDDEMAYTDPDVRPIKDPFKTISVELTDLTISSGDVVFSIPEDGDSAQADHDSSGQRKLIVSCCGIRAVLFSICRRFFPVRINVRILCRFPYQHIW